MVTDFLLELIVVIIPNARAQKTVSRGHSLPHGRVIQHIYSRGHLSTSKLSNHINEIRVLACAESFSALALIPFLLYSYSATDGIALLPEHCHCTALAAVGFGIGI